MNTIIGNNMQIKWDPNFDIIKEVFTIFNIHKEQGIVKISHVTSIPEQTYSTNELASYHGAKG